MPTVATEQNSSKLRMELEALKEYNFVYYNLHH